jgi:DNA-directed RNA polymerase specialized sigma24 family protein
MDADLVTRAQGGDQEAFADLVYAIGDRFLAVSHRILSDISLAEDATQQALLSVWQNLPQLRDPLRGLVVSAPRARLLRRGPEVPPLGAAYQAALG